MFKNKILSEIYNSNNEKTNFKSKYSLSLFDKIGIFIPFLNFFTIKKIIKKVENEIKRASEENNTHIDIDFEGNSLSSDVLNIRITKCLNILILIGLVLLLPNIKIISCIGIMLSTLSYIFHIILSRFITVSKDSCVSKEKIEKYVIDSLNKDGNILSKNELELIAKNIDKKILENFLVDNDFIITYKDLNKIDTLISENNNESRIKARKIIRTLSQNKIKENNYV